VLGTLASQGVIGAAAGVSGGLAVAWVLNRITMPGGLHPLFVVASAVLIFGTTAVLNGSGFLAVYLAGLILGNRPVRAFPSILSFHDAATWLVQLVMFILLGLLVTPSILLRYAVPALVLAVFLIFVGRPLAVWLCLWPFGFTGREKLFISWVGLRGAVSIFLAAVPMLSGVPNAEVYFNIAFFIVLVSLLVQGWTLTWTAKRLHVALDQPAPEARRVEIDLPGQLELEMVGYPILADSPVRTRRSLPSWVRPVFIVRNNEILAPDQAGRFQAGDYGYFLASPNRVQRLDRLFAPREADDPKTAGVFLFKGEVRLADVALTYGLPVPDDLKALTIAEAFAERFENRLALGDVLHLGATALIAIETDGDLLLHAALEFEDEDNLAGEEPLARGSDGSTGGSGLLRIVDVRSRTP
jgi:cell volume regulation protein A